MKTKPKLWTSMSADERKLLVAIQIFGWKPEKDWPTSIAAAFEVVEKMREKGYEFECATSGASMGDWRAGFENDASIYSAFSDSLPEAICLAALRAHGVKVE